MLLDTGRGLKRFHHQLTEFLSSSDVVKLFAALTTGSAAPYDEFIPGLRVSKTDTATKLAFSGDGWLELT